MDVIDISMPIHVDMQVYKNKDEKRPRFETTADFPERGFHETRLHLDAHTGTHVDAPLHMIPDGATIESITLSRLVRPCRVVDCSSLTACITARDIAAIGPQADEFLLFHTRNSEVDEFLPEFVYIREDAARELARARVAGVGVDGLGVERSQPEHPTHKVLFAAGVVIIEGLRLHGVVPGVYTLVAAPLSLRGIDASPARVLLLPPQP
ncbi:MAG: cyclase family protein [Firmicutes bacterium]|nr:cyclase family protein [Bacillota bacterium]